MFSIDGAFLKPSSQLPDISWQNASKTYQKGHKKYFFSEKMTSGNSGDAFL